jgi:putative lipoic acid-binding regulatory protein
MTEEPKPELIFPCDFSLKVIGKDEDQFMDFVVELVSHHVPGLPVESFSAHSSSAGKYLSISVAFMAESRAQVDALYQELTRHKRILMAL